MTDCVVVQPIAPCGVDLMRRAGLVVFDAPAPDLTVLAPHLALARAVITRDKGFSAEAMAAAPHLILIASHGTGTDRIDKAMATAQGIRVVNTPGTNAQSVAEHALALIFACARHIPEADRALRAEDWAIRERLRPIEMAGRCLGLVGFGHVARHLAPMAKGIGMEVLVHSDHATDQTLAAAGVARAASLDDLLARADIVSLHGLPAEQPVLDARRLARMKRDAIVVNTARGALIDAPALAQALRQGQIRAAGLDVFATEPLPRSNPLLDCPNLIMTPHMGGSAREALERTSLEVARLVIDGLGPPE